jgi:hypothetical protein
LPDRASQRQCQPTWRLPLVAVEVADGLVQSAFRIAERNPSEPR